MATLQFIIALRAGIPGTLLDLGKVGLQMAACCELPWSGGLVHYTLGAQSASKMDSFSQGDSFSTLWWDTGRVSNGRTAQDGPLRGGLVHKVRHRTEL